MNAKPRDLEDRTARLAENVRRFVRTLPRTLGNIEDAKQLVRSSGSVAADCVEADEAPGDRDRIRRFCLARKEAKESQLWLRRLHTTGVDPLAATRTELRQEAHELKLIFTATIKKLGRWEIRSFVNELEGARSRSDFFGFSRFDDWSFPP